MAFERIVSDPTNPIDSDWASFSYPPQWVRVLPSLQPNYFPASSSLYILKT